METHSIFSFLSTIQAKDWFLLFVGAAIGSIASYITAAQFTDIFHLPFLNNKYNLFPEGNYNLIGPSRELESIVTWKAEVRKRWLRASQLRLWITWKDDLYQQTKKEKLWEYVGPIFKKGEFIIARLDLKHHRHHEIRIDGKIVRTSFRETDPCFLVFHRSTETWDVQPGVMCGFSSVHSSCYGAIHILVPQVIKLSEEQKFSLLDGKTFIDYAEAREKARRFAGSHGAWPSKESK